ncbi:FadR/GntR family transcriptional regulator [Williamsia soli]|uniref:FadR/GntR family transcriptional regulator n=1 Tax=Williamsia soli TaxID=364929 RepID=UPI001A9D0F42|nr:GntR family transcriptional regulator [Williamsia soli]
MSGSTMASRIISQIKSAIFAGDLQPGQRLGTEKNIADEFGVSRMAARDAIRGLEALGAVDVRVGPKGGVYIGQPNAQKLSDTMAVQFALLGVKPQELIDAQGAIEKASISMAAGSMASGSISPDKIDALRESLAEFYSDMEKATSRVATFVPRVIALHEELVEASGNRVLTNLFKSIRLLLAPIYLRVADNTPEEDVENAIRLVMSSHGDLLDFLAEGNPSSAQQIIGDRLQEIRDALVQMGA